MDDAKYTPVLTVRLMKRGAILAVHGQAQIMVDPAVPRELMLAILRHVIQVLESGRSPQQIAQLRL